MAAAFDSEATPRLLCPRLIAPAFLPLFLSLSLSLSLLSFFFIIQFDYFLMANAIAKTAIAYILR